MTLLAFFKNANVKFIINYSGAFISLIAAVFALDSRYAHATDVEKENSKTQQVIQETTQTLRKQILEDKIFELDMKKAESRNQKLEPLDSAMHERYKRQLRELSRK